MKRRDLLKAGAAAAVLSAAGASANAADTTPPAADAESALLAPPCGLYCGVCIDRAAGECHGCGCACGRCAGKVHADSCGIAKCARDKKISSCADCPDFACTRLIQFTCDPIWRTHQVCIENLRRRKALGPAGWIREQQAWWADEANVRRWNALAEQCSQAARAARGRR